LLIRRGDGVGNRAPADGTGAAGPRWCLVGNIVAERPYGPDGEETRRGTKHFAPGTKVYCLPAQWGDGYQQIKVVGRHRGSKRLVTMVISCDWVTNFRAMEVHSPAVLRRLDKAGSGWKSRKHVLEYVASIAEYVRKGGKG